MPAIFAQQRELSAAADQATALRQRLGLARGAISVAPEDLSRWEQFAMLKLEKPSVAVLLEAVSRSLPDDAWLTELRFQGDQIRLIGSARDAGRLIAAIEASPQLEKAEFAAATSLQGEGEQGRWVRGQDRIEQFNITARVLPTLELQE